MLFRSIHSVAGIDRGGALAGLLLICPLGFQKLLLFGINLHGLLMVFEQVLEPLKIVFFSSDLERLPQLLLLLLGVASSHLLFDCVDVERLEVRVDFPGAMYESAPDASSCCNVCINTHNSFVPRNMTG